MQTAPKNLPQPLDVIEQFCERWHITEFALFGSVLRDDFCSDSDIDVLVTFAPDFQRGFNETIQIKQELEVLFGRKVDLLIKTAITRSSNWLRRRNILESAEVIYAKGS
ncbi:DNA polymerase subunit beta (plasmid) [Picosynechococcus sp. PCC 7003]|uniref:nucleotidyltransferase family protein n=1 Tax=Picosynechococcus sp. PCC 7003 TaxID=374981 RepID=UPI0008107D33|nr:nucleotidyltransferase domain-containing protein [Picosynechococcus sp. PCC 7003]ANV85842.1 DNA polymerase subunit beta [Picosynechococcus sp. PCC 7003]